MVDFFLKFYMKLEGLRGQKLTEPRFSEKVSFWGRNKASFKIGFCGSCKKLKYVDMY